MFGAAGGARIEMPPKIPAELSGLNAAPHAGRPIFSLHLTAREPDNESKSGNLPLCRAGQKIRQVGSSEKRPEGRLGTGRSFCAARDGESSCKFTQASPMGFWPPRDAGGGRRVEFRSGVAALQQQGLTEEALMVPREDSLSSFLVPDRRGTPAARWVKKLEVRYA